MIRLMYMQKYMENLQRRKQLTHHLHPEEEEAEELLLEEDQILALQMMTMMMEEVVVDSVDNLVMDSNVHLLKCMRLALHVVN